MDDYMLTEHQPEIIPFYAEEGYESPYGDGFETEQFDYEESDIEGEDDLEDTTDGNFNQDNQAPQNEGTNGQTQEENNNNDGTYDDGTNNQQDGYYDDGTNNQQNDGYYDDGTGTQDEYYEGSNSNSPNNGYYY